MAFEWIHDVPYQSNWRQYSFAFNFINKYNLIDLRSHKIYAKLATYTQRIWTWFRGMHNTHQTQAKWYFKLLFIFIYIETSEGGRKTFGKCIKERKYPVYKMPRVFAMSFVCYYF